MSTDQNATGARPLLKRRLPVLMAALWTCFIWGNSLHPADVSSAASNSVTNFFSQWIPWLTDHIIRKTAHFTEYAVLGCLLALILFLTLGRGRRDVPLILLLGLSIPLADESIQLFVPGRSGEVKDVLLDFSGVLFGLAVGSLATTLILRRVRGKGVPPRKEAEE